MLLHNAGHSEPAGRARSRSNWDATRTLVAGRDLCNPGPMTDSLPFLAGGGEAARMIAERDWSDHPLGPPQT